MTAIEVEVDEQDFENAGESQQRKLRNLAQRLREDPLLGERIRHKQIPKKFRNLPNPFRLELPGGWRALYTVMSSQAREIRVRVVWIGDHTRYDRLFGYG